MRVNTDELQRQANELQAVASRINDIQDSVLRIARNLGREQFGERFRYPLNNAAAAVGRRSDEVRKMRTALQQISRLYERTETQIVDEAEHASVHHEQSGFGSINIPDIQNIINNPIITRGPGNIPSWIGTRPDWIRVPPVVPIGVASILRDLIGRNRNQERNHSIAEEILENLENLFRDQYGPQWISEGSANRLRMRAILEEFTESVREGVTPDIDSVAEDIARSIREGISGRIPSLNEQRTDPFMPGIPEEFMDAIRDSIQNNGDSGYIPPDIHDIPTIDPSNIFDNTPPVNPGDFADVIRDAIRGDGNSGYIPPDIHDIPTIDPSDIFDNTPPVNPGEFADVIRDAIRGDGNSGYIPPDIHDIPTIDPSDIFEGSSISDGISGGASNIADFISGEVQINENIFHPLGPDSNPSPISDSVIRDAFNSAVDAFADGGSGLNGVPIASLDPVGPSLMPDPIISSIDMDAGMSSIAGDIPTMGDAIAGGVGAIDWTPWNP